MCGVSISSFRLKRSFDEERSLMRRARKYRRRRRSECCRTSESDDDVDDGDASSAASSVGSAYAHALLAAVAEQLAGEPHVHDYTGADDEADPAGGE